MLVVMTRLVSACEDIQILLTCVLYEVWKIKVEPICFNLCLKMKYLALNYIIGSFHKQWKGECTITADMCNPKMNACEKLGK